MKGFTKRFLFASLSMPLVIKEKEVFQGNIALFSLFFRSQTYQSPPYKAKKLCFLAL